MAMHITTMTVAWRFWWRHGVIWGNKLSGWKSENRRHIEKMEIRDTRRGDNAKRKRHEVKLRRDSEEGEEGKNTDD